MIAGRVSQETDGWHWGQGVGTHQRPADGAQQDVDGRDARALAAGLCVDEGDGECEQDPADDVVADAGREDDDADRRLEQLELGQDPAQDGERRDRHGRAREQEEVAKVDRGRDELVVDRHGDLRAGEEEGEGNKVVSVRRKKEVRVGRGGRGRTAAPRPNGRIMPANAMTADSRALRRMMPMSTSRPTRNRNRTRPGAW